MWRLPASLFGIVLIIVFRAIRIDFRRLLALVRRDTKSELKRARANEASLS
jgi:hypothetical protein